MLADVGEAACTALTAACPEVGVSVVGSSLVTLWCSASWGRSPGEASEVCLGRGRSQRTGGFKKVKGAYICLLMLGTQWLGVAWVTWVMDGKGSGWFLGLRQGHQLDGRCCRAQSQSEVCEGRLCVLSPCGPAL